MTEVTYRILHACFLCIVYSNGQICYSLGTRTTMEAWAQFAYHPVRSGHQTSSYIT